LAVIIGKLDVRHIFICTNRQHPQAPSDSETHVPAAVAMIREQRLYQTKEERRARTSRD